MKKKYLYLLGLFVVGLLALVLAPTYAMFQNSYLSENDIVGIRLSFNVGITNIEEYEEINVSPGDAEIFNVQITNSSSNTAYYGIWYKMIEPSTINSNIKVAKFKGTRDVSTSGSLSSKGVKTVTLVVVNDGDSSIKLNIGVASSSASTSYIEYLNGKKLVTDTVTGLSSVAVGSYVDYTGSNGCSGNACKGQNANYVNDTNKGYCDSSSYKFTVNGWRVGYKKDNSAYLVSAGAPECVSTYVENRSGSTSNVTFGINNYYYGSGYTFNDATGTFSLTGVTSSTKNFANFDSTAPYTCKGKSQTATCSTLYQVVSVASQSSGEAYTYYNYDGAGVPNHIKHLNEVALKYCNANYAYGGVCNKNSAWAMNGDDFDTILTYGSLSQCHGTSTAQCGNGYDLINNGGYYWFATSYSSISENAFSWKPDYRYVSDNYSNYLYGVRPVLRLSSSVLVVGGSGTETDPYRIKLAKNKKTYLSSVEPGSYVAYTGNNGCSGNACKGQNANYVSDTDKGYCYSNYEKFKVNGWRVGYVKDGKAHLVSAGAPECVSTMSTSYVSKVSSSPSQVGFPVANVYYSSSYWFNPTTGSYTLTGSPSASPYAQVNMYTCKSTSSTATCSTMWKVVSLDSSRYNGTAYVYTSTKPAASPSEHIDNLNNQALKYCNSTYAFGGVCNNNTAWAMYKNDFEKITSLNFYEDSECQYNMGSINCSISNDLIANGGIYWFATYYTDKYDNQITGAYFWGPALGVDEAYPYNIYGLRPVIKLSQDVYITGGTGTEEEPYTISI